MSEEPTTASGGQRGRNVTIAFIVVIAVGIIGMGAAFFVGGDDSSDPGARTTPGAGIDPLTVEGQCRGAGVIKVAVDADPDDEPELTATGATENWVLSGESATTVSAGDDAKLVAIGKIGELPREVLTVSKADGGWTVVGTAGCLDATESSRACTAETVRVAGKTYDRETAAGDVEAGEYVGNGTLTSCPRLVDGKQLAPRGVIGPVSVYAVKGRPQAVSVTDDTETRVFIR